MRRRVPHLLLASLVSASALPAQAATEAPAPLALPAPSPQRDAQAPGAERLHPLSITFNPLAVVIRRYGGNLELVPLPHHAFVASAYAQIYSPSMVRAFVPTAVRDYLSDTQSTLLGGEIGYRLYTGRRGADGLFLGPSFLMTPLAYPRLAGRSVELETFYAPGVAFDVGVQAVTGFGLTIGGGVGVEYLAYTLPDDPARVPIELSPHILPRLLLAAGWSF